MKSQYILEHLLDVFKKVEVSHDPFSHFYTSSCFPDEIYQTMIRNLPDVKYYGYLMHPDAKCKDGTSTRFRLVVTNPRQLNNLPPVSRDTYSTVAEALVCPHFKQVVFNHFSENLSERFNCDRNSVNDIKAYPQVILMRDVAGYKIRIHPDTLDKIVTMQFYLPQDNSQVDLGTSIYRKVKNEKFIKVKTFDFKPNSGYGFAVSNKSFHGRDVLSDDVAERNSLLLIYFIKPNRGY